MLWWGAFAKRSCAIRFTFLVSIWMRHHHHPRGRSLPNSMQTSRFPFKWNALIHVLFQNIQHFGRENHCLIVAWDNYTCTMLSRSDVTLALNLEQLRLRLAADNLYLSSNSLDNNYGSKIECIHDCIAGVLRISFSFITFTFMATTATIWGWIPFRRTTIALVSHALCMLDQVSRIDGSLRCWAWTEFMQRDDVARWLSI